MVTTDVVGHYFTVLPRIRMSEEVQQQDLDKFTEDLAIEREEPEQLKVVPVSDAQASEKVTEQAMVEDAITNLQEWLVAAAQMQTILGEKLKDRRVTVDPKRNPAVRDAIRRLFGEDSNTITYDMYKKALEWRSEVLKEGRNETYGAGS
jgi:hypothetical protein